MSRHRNCLGELTLPENLDLVCTAFDETMRTKRGFINLRTLRKDLERADVHFRDDIGERVAEPALRQATMNRRLSAFEVRLESANARVLAFLAATCGFAEARAEAATTSNFLR